MLARTWGLFGGALDSPPDGTTSATVAVAPTHNASPANSPGNLKQKQSVRNGGSKYDHLGTEEWTLHENGTLCQEEQRFKNDGQALVSGQDVCTELALERSDSPELVMLWEEKETQIFRGTLQPAVTTQTQRLKQAHHQHRYGSNTPHWAVRTRIGHCVSALNDQRKVVITTVPSSSDMGV